MKRKDKRADKSTTPTTCFLENPKKIASSRLHKKHESDNIFFLTLLLPDYTIQ